MYDHGIRKLILMITAICMMACSASIPNEHVFDYSVECTTRKQIQEIQEMDFVEEVFPFSIMSFQKNENAIKQMAVLAVESFDCIDCSPYGHDSFVQYNAQLLEDTACNPIIINQNPAENEQISIGDPLVQENRMTDEPVQFTVAAITSQSPLFAEYEVLILCSKTINRLFYDVMSEPCYTNAYIKALDSEQLMNYMYNTFVPMPGIDVHETDILKFERDEVEHYFETEQEHMHRMK